VSGARIGVLVAEAAIEEHSTALHDDAVHGSDAGQRHQALCPRTQGGGMRRRVSGDLMILWDVVHRRSSSRPSWVTTTLWAFRPSHRPRCSVKEL
jgi:hypothetical protein